MATELKTSAPPRECNQFIAGEWVDASDGGTFDDIDPYTGASVARVPAGTRDDARRAIEAPADAAAAWASTPPAARQSIFLRAADILDSRYDEVADWLTRETGCTFGFAMFQLHFVPGLFRQAAGAAYNPVGAGPIGDELVENPLVRRINFTGSTATGRRLAEAAGRHLKRVVLELGGQNPLIVLADADLGYAVDAAAFGAFLHQGQICMPSRRIIVERPIADEFVERLAAKTAGLKAGNPTEHDTIIGPLINSGALETVTRRVEDAVAKGARVLAGGEAVGSCYQATLLADVPADSELAQVETFGPVAAVEVAETAEDAVRRANETAYGLSGGIITSDPERGLALAEQLDTGIVHVNDQTVHDEPQMPFGGVKGSGWGRFGGAFAMDEFTELRWITVQSGTRPFPF